MSLCEFNHTADVAGLAGGSSDFSISPRKKGALKIRTEVTLTSLPSIFDITQIQSVQSTEASINKFQKIFTPQRRSLYQSSNQLSNERTESSQMKSTQNLFRVASLRKLKKLEPAERTSLKSFQKKFEVSRTLGDAMDFSRDSDAVYEQNLQIPDTDLQGEILAAQKSDKRDDKKNVMVGYLSQLSFFRHHKDMYKIQQENEHYKVKDSLYTKLIKSQQTTQLLPKKLGLIKQNGSESTISINHFHLGDRYAQMFAKGMESVDVRSSVKKYELGNNGLSDKGLVLILKALSQNTEDLDLSKNTFGQQATDMLVMILRNFEFSLRRLNLDSAKLGDSHGVRLLEALKKLQVLNLSNNKLTDEVSLALASAISIRCQLQELYLHWNLLTGVSGERIAKALHDNSSIRVLDLSNNSLGLQNGDACAQAFSTLFAMEESELMHVDIGNNRWSKAQVTVLSKGINQNKTIYGFHLESKFASIDEFGFLSVTDDSIDSNEGLQFSSSVILPQINQVPPISRPPIRKFSFSGMVNNDMATPFQRINGLTPAKLQSHQHVQGNQKICWICNAWSEQLFLWKGGESGMSYNGPIFVHMDFDSYVAIPLEKDDSGYFYVRRMCPPTQKLLYFFSTPDGDTHAKDQPSVKNKNPHLKDISFGPRKCRDITIKFLNHRTVAKTEGSLFSTYFEPIHITVLPREQLKYPQEEELPKKEAWTKEKSVFSKYVQDNQLILEKAMDADWNNSKIPRFVKDTADRKKLFDLIMPHYEGIKALYKYYSSFSPIGDVWAIPKLLFVEIFTKSGLVDNRTLKLSDLEIKFIASKSTNKKQRGSMVPERGLVRHEFLESMIRIAEEKYMINGDCTSYAEAVSYLLNDGFLKLIAEIDSPVQWRDERYWNQECDFCYKYYMQILMTIFETYENTIRMSLPKSKYLNLSEFKKIFYDTNIFVDPHANERYVNLAFNFSVQTQTDEVYDERILQLHFIEFLEAIARAAEKLSPAPQINPNLNQETQPKMDWETRFAQPLHKKIENMIRFIFYFGLPAEKSDAFELHELSIFDQKEINEAMVAPMRSKVVFKSNLNLNAVVLNDTSRLSGVQKISDMLRKQIKNNK